MKPKLLKRLSTFLMSLVLVITCLPVTALAEKVNGSSIPGSGDSGYVSGFGWWDTAVDGARVTLVDATSGKRAGNYPSIDYTNLESLPGGSKGRIALEDVRHYGKWCKSDYTKLGLPLDMEEPSIKYDYVKPPAGFPLMLNAGKSGKVSIDTVKAYFGDEAVIRFFVSNINKQTKKSPGEEGYLTYEEVTSGRYKFMIEPIVYMSIPSDHVAYAATITEMGLWNKATNDKPGAGFTRPNGTTGNNMGYVARTWGGTWYYDNWPRSLFLEEDDLGYTAWNNSNAKTEHNNAGKYRNDGISDDQIISQMGIATISFGTPDPTVYHHIYNLQLSAPKGASFKWNGHIFPLDSRNVLQILTGKPIRNDKGEEIPGDIELISAMIQHYANNGWINYDTVPADWDQPLGSGGWDDGFSYQIDKTAPNSGFVEVSGKNVYKVSQDEKFAAEMASKGVPYLIMSSEVTSKVGAKKEYVGPESGNTDDVHYRYGIEGATFTNKYAEQLGVIFNSTKIQTLTLFTRFINNLVNDYKDRGVCAFNDAGLWEAQADEEYHTATFLISVTEAPTDIYYHTATYDIKLKPGQKRPTTTTEILNLVKDITPSWTKEKSTTDDPTYDWFRDPKLPTAIPL